MYDRSTSGGRGAGRRRRTIPLLVSLLPLAISLPGPSPPLPAAADLSASVPPQAESPVSEPPPAPAEVARRAVDAQRDFERLRRRHLPLAWPRYERCDEVVGRFCLWHEDEDREPPPEAPAVTEGRASLLSVLEAAAESLPAGSGPRIGALSALEWVQGHRIRYLAEAGRVPEVRRAARECRGAAAWCRALEGYAAHAAGDWLRAGEAFAAALTALPEEERCRWDDLSPLLDGAGRARYGDLPCGDRGRVEARFWWLADPLWSVPGDERRTEHYSRHVLDRLQEEAGSGYGVVWGSDLRELLLRYGWPAGWERVRPRPGSLSAAGTAYLARDPVGARRWAPRGEWLDRAAVLEPGAAEEEVHEPRSRYAPAHAPELRPLGHQLARFRRGREMVVVAGWERPGPDPGEAVMRGDPGSAACPGARIGLVVARSPSDDPAVALASGEERTGALSVEVAPPSSPPAGHGGRGPPSGAHPVASLEWLCPGRLLARSRYTVEPVGGSPAEPGLSDLLLLRGGEPLPETLPEAARRARGSLRVGPGEAVGLYWEVYGVRKGAEAEVSVLLVREGGGFFRKVGAFLGLVGERTPAAELRWRDGASGPVVGRAATLRVPELEEGDYRLELRVTPVGGAPRIASRDLRVSEPEE